MKGERRMGGERAMMEGLEERRMMSVSALSLASIPDGTSNITDGTSNTIFVGAANGGVWKTTNSLAPAGALAVLMDGSTR